MESLCLLGDSVAKGIVCDPQTGRYVHSGRGFLHLFCEAHGFALLDHARFGCTLSKAQALAERHAGEFSRCRATLVMLGGNDCDYDWAAVAADPNPGRPCHTEPQDFTAGYISLLERIQKNGGHPVVLGMVPVLGRRYYRWITARSGETGIRDFLIHFERIEHWNELYNLSLRRIADAAGAPLVDLRSPLLFRRDIEDFYCPDGIHPNGAGHRLLYEQCRDALLQAVLAQPVCM